MRSIYLLFDCTLNTQVARFLSVIFHPLLIPTYLFGIIFWRTPDFLGIGLLSNAARGSLAGLIFLNTFVAPVMLIWYFKKMGYLPDFELDDIRYRRLPYAATFVLYAITTYLLGWNMDPVSYLAPGIAFIMGSITAAIGLVGLVSLEWKISAHATALGGLLGALGVLFVKSGSQDLYIPFILGILVTGWVIAARLRLNAHTPEQVAAGLCLGLCISVLSTLLYF